MPSMVSQTCFVKRGLCSRPDLGTFDVGPTFRHMQYEEYKANRGMPDELRFQIPVMKDSHKLGIGRLN